MQYGEYHPPLGDHVESGREGYQKTEKETKKEDASVKAEDIHARYYHKKEDRGSHERFRKKVFLQTYYEHEEKKKQNFDPCIDPLKKVVS